MADKTKTTRQPGFPAQMGLLAEQMNNGFGGGLLVQQKYLEGIFSAPPVLADTPVTPVKPTTPVTPQTPPLRFPNPATYQEMMANRQGMSSGEWNNWVQANTDLFNRLSSNQNTGRGRN